MASRSFPFFCVDVLPEYFPDSLADVHVEIMGRLADEWQDELFVLPRKHAKTTIVSKAYVLWLIATKRLHFITLFSNTNRQAASILADIRRVLKKSAKFRKLFDDLLPMGNPDVKDNDNEIITSTGICVKAAGSGTEVRGWTFGPYRPELIIGDDLESRDTVTTKDQRNKLELWWDADVQPMRHLAQSRIVIVGTILHQDSVLARKRAKGTYRVFFRKAIVNEPTRRDLWDEWSRIASEQGKEAADALYAERREEMEAGATVLWPEGMSLKKLMDERREQGPFAFQTEYQNDPVPPDSTVIKREWIDPMPHFVDGNSPYIVDGTEIIPLSDLTIYGSVDPAISKKEKADFSVMATGGRHKDGRIYLFDMLRLHAEGPELMRLIVASFQKWNHTRIGIEAVAYQKALKQFIDDASAKEGIYVPTAAVIPDTDKVRRMVRWQPQFEQRLVRICDSVPSSCVDELTQFPLAEHDDVPDAVSQLLLVILKSQRKFHLASA